MKGCDKCHPWAPKSLDDSLLKRSKICGQLYLHLFVDASQTALPPRGPAGQGDHCNCNGHGQDCYLHDVENKRRLQITVVNKMLVILMLMLLN